MERTILRPAEVAVQLKVSINTLKKWRARGIGPDHFTLHKRHVVYDQAAVESWLQEQRRGTGAA